MKYSIIIPTHNGADRIGRAIMSIIKQKFEPREFEIIVVCDACEDNTYDVAINTVAGYNAEVISCNYGNAGMARNEGLRKAKGEYILFMDDDDMWLHEFVLRIIDRNIAEMDADIYVYGFVTRQGQILRPFDNSGMMFGNVWSRVYKKSFIGETKFPKVYPDDDLQFNKLLEAKKPIIFTSDEVIYWYDYMRPGSITDKESKNG